MLHNNAKYVVHLQIFGYIMILTGSNVQQTQFLNYPLAIFGRKHNLDGF